jgi:hypothetical protein
MPITQIYIPLFVRFPRDPKVRALVVRHGVDGILAAYLYIVMALYCRENLTDGMVPDEEVGALAYPLPPDHAERLTKLLLDQELIKRSSPGSSQGSSHGLANAVGGAWLVAAYVPINGTREQVEERAAKLSAAGRKGAASRQVNGDEQAMAKPGLKWSPSDVLSQTEKETEKLPPRARPRAPTRARGAHQPPPASQVLTRTGPASDAPRDRAAEARAALAGRDRPPEVPEGGPPPLHGEELARAQLDATRAGHVPDVDPAPAEDELPF